MAIQIDVTPSKVTITNKSELSINQGEYNINNCEFTFSEEYNNLEKRAVFYNVIGQKFMAEIKNNACVIPKEILQTPGVLYIGVYGFEVGLNDIVLRYSPSPDNISLNEGSYRSYYGDNLAPETSKDLIVQVKELIAQTDAAIAEVNTCVENANIAIDNDIAKNDSAVADAIANANSQVDVLIGRVNVAIDNTNTAIDKVNSITFELDENGYLILTEND